MSLTRFSFGCVMALSMVGNPSFADEQPPPVVRVHLNSLSNWCEPCSWQPPGSTHWQVLVSTVDDEIIVVGTANAVVDYIYINCAGASTEYCTLYVTGSYAEISDISRADFSSGDSELWIPTIGGFSSAVDVLGSVNANIIGSVTVGSVTGQVQQIGSSIASSSTPGISSLSVGTLSGDISAADRIGIVAASGDIGSTGDHVSISSGDSIGGITADAVYASISITGSAADLDWLQTTVGDFSGSLMCRKIVGTTASGAYGLRVAGDLKADIDHTAVMNTDWRIGGSFGAGAVIDLPEEGLTEQIIFAAGGSGSWSSTAHIELANDALDNEPYYTNPATGSGGVGGGSAGLATFDVHHESCSPAEGASTLGYGPHYTCLGEEDCCERF